MPFLSLRAVLWASSAPHPPKTFGPKIRRVDPTSSFQDAWSSVSSSSERPSNQTRRKDKSPVELCLEGLIEKEEEEEGKTFDPPSLLMILFLLRL